MDNELEILVRISEVRATCCLCAAVDDLISDTSTPMQNIEAVAKYDGMLCGGAELKRMIACDFLRDEGRM